MKSLSKLREIVQMTHALSILRWRQSFVDGNKFDALEFLLSRIEICHYSKTNADIML